jgi:hypothetical protein
MLPFSGLPAASFANANVIGLEDPKAIRHSFAIDYAEGALQQGKRIFYALRGSIEHIWIRVAAQPFVEYGINVVAGIAEQRHGVPRQVLVKLEAGGHPLHLCWNRNNPLPGKIGGVRYCRGNMFRLQRWVLVENVFRGLVCGKVVENNRNGNPRSTEADSAVQYLRVYGDVVRPIHRDFLRRAAAIYHCAGSAHNEQDGNDGIPAL